ncbi:uncharacterized protein LOC115627654 [Scaptodrosophila lebanonensis]|uniref:Uncharacterized protein LOC115627654 n=1 Tax=Drosophila lebanonensis TaxID=7225 RepID=A0A6J2TT60_DROLE|nr:uncharacterized protein LOC115627654 [Scaptodrosophila lebanonensis]
MALLVEVAGGALEAPSPWQSTPLAAAALHIIDRYIGPFQRTLLIAGMCDNCTSWQRDRQEQLLSQLLLSHKQDVAIQLYRGVIDEKPISYFYMFVVNSLAAFRALEFTLPETLFDREFYFVIVLTSRTATESDIEKIFFSCMYFHVLHVVLLVELPDIPVVLFYSYDLFSSNCSHLITPKQVNRFANGRLQHDRLFVNNFEGFYGCPLNVSWYLLPPFVTFRGDGHNRSHRAEVERLNGIDGELLRVLADIFNFRIQLLPPCGKSYITANGTVTGCYAALQSGRASIAIGALSGSHLRRHQFSTTSAYHQSALVFVVRMRRTFGPISHLAAPFCRGVWLCILGSCVLVLILQWLHWRRLEIGGGTLNVLGTLLGNPLVFGALFSDTHVRPLFMSWMLLALVLRTLYQGKLFGVFCLPQYSGIPRNISELLDQNYTLLAADYLDFYPKQRTEIIQSSYAARFEQMENDPRPKLTTTALLGNLIHYNQHKWETSTLISVEEPIYTYHLVMYLRRHSILKFGFDRKLRQLMSAGIVGYINRKYELSKFRYLQAARPLQIERIRLQMHSGLYLVCLLMLLMALIIFGLELLSLRVSRLRRFFEGG